ncbi:sulfite exporter TauE/SafE family protein [Propionibacterium australiense]|uniref:Probable membrane transporter protein n=1 Tax=Propionibacterium australiense TaxID=119981 RepID=A0A383S6L4_9ACTN|nr:sulfite exporter TauE/SafE family protein [Propionibacterium australiense]RLP09650.1 sulfite exporter TauE/SafE family protein [Propionibacterium australiense]RLP12352.1 sulfite exporter TauE/SafE family protein [Propionibacterium australiense]SYZ33557.1 Transmembrane protein TauE-like [Propionibacterium australiense]VEH89579.1 Sulfite exporter TauE/SafE [Propionibacterium australiense]
MTLFAFSMVVLAGVAAGIVGYLTGMASLVSYPALILLGVPPVTANASNTVGLLGSALGSAVKGARTFLPRSNGRSVVVQSVAAAVGGLVGAGLLLVGGDSTFAVVVPWLVLASALMILASPRLRDLQHGNEWPRWFYGLAIMLVFVYGGYFGAGSALMYLTVTMIATRAELRTTVYLKTIVIAAANLSSSVWFVCAGRVTWWAAIALLVGSMIGGWFGPVIAARIPDRALRWIIGVAGIGLACYLWRMA